MKDNIIILDLDDTLISTHLRQYTCIKDYLADTGITFIDYDSYYQLRRTNRYTNSALIKSLKIELDWEDYKAWYLLHIESEKYLALDSLIVDKQILAQTVQKGIQLVLLSLRSNHHNSLNQLKHLGLAGFFREIYFEDHLPQANPKLKRLEELKQANHILSFCGDSVSDYEAAELLNINFVQLKTSLYLQDDFKKATPFNDINQYLVSIP